jgi:hypothetical protein
MLWDAPAAALDNGTLLTTPSRAVILTGGTVVAFAKDYSTTSGGWTSTGNKRIASCTITYEAA